MGASEQTSQSQLRTRMFVEALCEWVKNNTHFWQQEIQQRPELMQIVLQRSARNKQTTLGVVEPNDLGEH